jgi:hypothetical protein
MSRAPDRLYNLLPVVYRERDEERGFPLRAVLRVMAEQVDVVEENIEQLYENWFIETCEDWVVPYIGDLIGYQVIHDVGEPTGGSTAEERALNRILVPRRDVANTIRYRRRKGARALLELLANDVAGWPARVVEFGRLVSVTQALNHSRFDAGLTANIGVSDILDLVDGPFDRLAHTADIRSIGSAHDDGRYGLHSVGVFVWRLRAFSLTKSPAYLVEERSGDNCFTFSILGTNTRLYSHPIPEALPTDIAQEPNLPVPIRRRAFEQRRRRRRDVERRASEAYYGEDRSVALWTLKDAQTRELELIPRDRVIPADLTDWAYEPQPGFVAVDPILGRVVFAAGYGPKDGLWVSYHYGFPADLGGGEYERKVRTGFRIAAPARSDPAAAPAPGAPATPGAEPGVRVPLLLKVGKHPETDFQTITDALAAVRDDVDETLPPTPAAKKPRRSSSSAAPEKPPPPPGPPRDAIIEIVDSEVYEEEQLQVVVKADQSLEIRAASGVRPVIRRVDWHASRQDDLSITLATGSRFFLDGILIAGRGIEVGSAGAQPPRGEPTYAGDRTPAPPAATPAPQPVKCETRQVTIRHCTLVPGWALHNDCTPVRPTEPSITLQNAQANLIIENSIVGSIQINEDVHDEEPVTVAIADSIVDATSRDGEAIGASGRRAAHAVLRLERSTVIGRIETHAIDLAENCILDGHLIVARKQIGCMRFCYVPPGSRTPRRYRCQPEAAVGDATGDARDRIEQRIRPRFTSRRYGSPDYCQLAFACPDEIARGADDGSEMGVYHRLFQPQRTTNLRTRLTEYVPAGVDVDIIFAS